MAPARCTHILFDFFGTLVDYSNSRTEQGFERTHRLLGRLGSDLTYQGFLAGWSRICAEFDQLSDRDDHEYSMIEVSTAFLARALGYQPAYPAVEAYVDQYLAEWNTGVRYLPEVSRLVAKLATEYRLAVVTNTHHARMVPNHLAVMGLESRFDAVITSVEVGWRKPDPRIYAAALDTLRIPAAAAVFVGDTYAPDFRGPRQAGIRAFLIDPDRQAPVPDDCRLGSVLDLPARLAGRLETGGPVIA